MSRSFSTASGEIDLGDLARFFGVRRAGGSAIFLRRGADPAGEVAGAAESGGRGVGRGERNHEVKPPRSVSDF